MLQQTLKEATKNNHTQLEEIMFVHEIMNATLSLHQYKQLLVANYLVHLRFEEELFANLGTEISDSLGVDKRKKLAALTKDLQELAIELSIPEAENFENIFDNDASILGAMYVLEGATLGGNLIAKKIKNNPHVNAEKLGFRYYQVYGDNLMDYWKEFCAALNLQPVYTYNTTVDAAKKMFEYIFDTHKKVLNKKA